MSFLRSKDIANLTGLSRQAVSLAIRRVLNNGIQPTWAQDLPVVKVVKSTGGRQGTQYLISLQSLKEEIQSLWKTTNEFDDDFLKNRVLDDGTQEANWKLEIILPIVAHCKGSAARSKAFKAVDGQRVRNHRGKKVILKNDTVRRWVKKYEDANSIRGLMTQSRSDKGKDRVIISRAWDNAVPFSDAVKSEIAEHMGHFIGALLAEKMNFSNIRWAVPIELRRITEEKGYRSDDIREICSLTDKFITKQRKYSALAVFKYDKKTYQDGKPSISRVCDLKPMEVVCFDVHHIDVVVCRADGTDVYPKLIGALDLGTGRFWGQVVFPKKGKMVTNADVIDAFSEMCADESWGVPKNVYADNGSEYNCLDFFGEIISLNSPSDKLEGLDVGRIIRAEPYAAQSKSIEQLFNKHNQAVIKHIRVMTELVGLLSRNNSSTRYAANLQTPKTPDSVITLSRFKQLSSASPSDHSRSAINITSEKSLSQFRWFKA